MPTQQQAQAVDWVRVTVRVTPEAAEAVGEVLRRAGCAGWESAGEDAAIGYLPADAQVGERIAGIWEEARSLDRYGLDPGPAEALVEVIQERPWEEVWKSYFRPMRVGRVVVCPMWESVDLGAGEVLVRLDPGMAFGSGAHATTRLCLAALAEELPAGGRVLDVGTGSGILAIAAARLGASRVLALDTDPDVLPIARENAALNEVGAVVEVRDGDITAAGEAGWDVIVANIAPEPVMQAAPTAFAILAPGGALVGGGIPASRAREVREAVSAAGLPVERVSQEEEWVAVIARRPA